MRVRAIDLTLVFVLISGCGGGERRTADIQRAIAREQAQCVSNLALIARTAPDVESGDLAIAAEEIRCEEVRRRLCSRAGARCDD